MKARATHRRQAREKLELIQLMKRVAACNKVEQVFNVRLHKCDALCAVLQETITQLYCCSREHQKRKRIVVVR